MKEKGKTEEKPVIHGLMLLSKLWLNKNVSPFLREVLCWLKSLVWPMQYKILFHVQCMTLQQKTGATDTDEGVCHL